MFGRNAHRFPPTCALITGASSGIGAAFARRLAPSAELVLVGRDETKLEELRRELPRASVQLVAADLATREGCETVVRAAEEARVDLLVNNAGLGTLGDVLEVEPEKLETMVEVNALAPVRLIRGILPGMLARAEDEGFRAGLIDVTSTAAFVSVPGFAAYAASKAFLQSFSESLTAELRGRPVDVLTLAPGPTRTDFGRRAGYSRGNLPGAASPDTVARLAMESLGRTPVLALGAEGPLFTGLSWGRQGFATLLGQARRAFG
jgi:hypothetical protein